MEIERTRKTLTPPAVGMRGGGNLEDTELRPMVSSMQANICALRDELAALRARVTVLEEPQPQDEDAAQYEGQAASDATGATGEFGRVRVSAGLVVEGMEEIEEVTEFPEIPERYTLISIEGQIWAAGPADTAWYPLYKFTDTEGEPGTTP